MDWTRARAILLMAFTMVNLVLVYSIWGPSNALPTMAGPSSRVQVEQLRTRLSDRGLLLPSGVLVPATPPPMRFLRVEYHPDLTFSQLHAEVFRRGIPEWESQPRAFEGTTGNPEPTLDPETRAILYRPGATGPAARDVRLDSRTQVRQAAEEYLKYQLLMPEGAQLSGIFPRETGMMVEFVPRYQNLPVYSGYTRVLVSARGIEQVEQLWVQPVGYKETASPKAVRPAAEALVRLAGHLERTGQRTRTIIDVRLGYYAGSAVTERGAEGVSAWDTVPVWRITLNNGLVYYINAFNGELES